MSIILLTAATGSPGVTSTALGLAVHWPRDVLLADCDREPGQSLQAGYLLGLDLGGRGLSELARAHRENRPVSEELQLQTVSFQSGAEHERHVLPGFAHPATPALFAPVWQPLAQALRAHSDSGRGVIVDAGRIGGTGLPSALLGASDLVLVCVRSSLRSLAALRLHLPTLQHQLDESSRAELGLLVVGPGRPYSSSEISRQFSVPVVHELAWEPRQAEVYSDGATPGRSWGGGQLNRSLRAAASALDERVRRREEVVAGALATSEWVSS
ncbi:hypothetical protein [Luteococcus peritonei]|uniref:ParA family protein n=1 Tax=Luteococcus peritonei TaxID=88874 RepID=A0ABW4RTS8_9ACTN